MRQHHRSRQVLALLLGLSLIAAACGDDDDTEAEGDGEDTEATEPEEEEEAEVDPKVQALLELGDADPQCEGETDGILRIGELTPQTGDLAILGPPIAAGQRLAIAEINAAGGVNGQPVEHLPGDSGDSDPDLANPTVDGHLAAGADVILGAAASGVSLNVIDKIVGACKIHFSPANTSPEFTTYEDDGLYFRTAPADYIQGKVLAELALENGVQTAAILARQDSYGEGLQTYFETPFTEAGGEVALSQVYDPEAPDFSAEVDAVVEADPDALIMIGFDESVRIIQGLLEAGFTPDEKQIYFVDGNTTDNVGSQFTEPGALEGVQGTFPAAQVSQELHDRLAAQDPSMAEPFLYGPETYDAVILLALAATQAGTDRPDEIARQINGLTRDGEKCTSFAQCRDLIAAGTDIDYDGASGPLDFGKPGEPVAGTIAIVDFGADNLTEDASGFEFRFGEVGA